MNVPEISLGFLKNSTNSFPEFDQHESVVRFADEKSGLRGFIAIHNTNLGSAVGGTRFWPYASEDEALRDALRLSRAMSYKCALAGVPHGGGKAVIIGDPAHPKSEELLKAYADAVNALGGKFYTGEDVGMTQEDVTMLSKYSPYMIGHEGMAGDPGPWAAESVFQSILAGLEAMFGNDDLRGRTVAIKGLGKVGLGVARRVYDGGGAVIGADLQTGAVDVAKKAIEAITIVNPTDIHKQIVDVYSPNALGGEINMRTLDEFRCKIICGGANNQLTSDAAGAALAQRGILYIPDYIANAGGLIDVADELAPGGYSRDRVERRVRAVRETVSHIITLAKTHKKPTNAVADELARGIFIHSDLPSRQLAL